MLGLLIVVTVVWGLAWPINKIGLDYLSPAWYTAIRLGIGTITMMGVAFAIDKFSLPDRRDLPLIFSVGLFQISFFILLANIGLHYLPAGRSAILAYSTPLWVMPVTLLFFNEKPSVFRWLGFLLGVAGIVILLSPWEMNWSNKGVVLGILVLLLSSLCWTISMLCARYMTWHKSPIELIGWQLLIGVIPVLCYAMISEPVIHVQWSLPLVLSLVYTGIVVTGLSYWGGLTINKELPTLVASLGFLLVPVYSLLFSALFLKEVLTMLTCSAMTCVVLGLMFVLR